MLILLYLLFISSFFPRILILRSQRGLKYSVSTRFFLKKDDIVVTRVFITSGKFENSMIFVFYDKKHSILSKRVPLLQKRFIFFWKFMFFFNFHNFVSIDFPIEFFGFLKKNWNNFQNSSFKLFWKRYTIRKSGKSRLPAFFGMKKCVLSSTVNVSIIFLQIIQNKNNRNYSQNL